MKQNLLFTLTAAVLLVGGCGEGTPSDTSSTATADADAVIVAVVNGVEIPESRVALYSQQPVTNDEELKLVVDNMISSELIAQAAQNDGLADTTDIKDQLAIARQAVLGRAYVTQFIDANPITEEQQQARYKQLIEEYADAKEYNAAHILVDDEETANDLLAKIKADPTTFADLAKEHSSDKNSAAEGGSLGWFIGEAVVTEFGDALKKLNKSDITEAPVKSHWGWHIIRLDDVRPAPAPELNDAMRERLEQTMRAEQVTKHVLELREKATVEIR